MPENGRIFHEARTGQRRASVLGLSEPCRRVRPGASAGKCPDVLPRYLEPGFVRRLFKANALAICATERCSSYRRDELDFHKFANKRKQIREFVRSGPSEPFEQYHFGRNERQAFGSHPLERYFLVDFFARTRRIDT